ncbi:MAG: acetylglutamate kinase [Chitinophagaceae bacterium]
MFLELLSIKLTVLNDITNIITQSPFSPLGVGGDKLFIIKIGGNVIDDEKNLAAFLDDIAKIKGKCLLVHGGGKIATKIGEQLGIAPNYVNGRRITDADTIDLVTMVYGGLVNKKIVAQLQARNCNAIGLTGADANIIPAVKRPVKEIDYGFVGDVSDLSKGISSLQLLLDNGLLPVFAPLTHDGKGQVLNTNADTIASSLAIALSGLYDVRLIYCFEKKGVLENVADDNSVIRLITKDVYKTLKDGNKLFDGILPKIDNAFAAIDKGVKEVMIGDAKDLLRNVTSDTAGTLIK